MGDPPGAAGAAPPKSALIVEDDLSILRLLEGDLTAAGFRCSTAGTVGEAWRLIQDDDPDVAVVDIHLPGAFGWELVERVRTDQRLHRMPIIVISGEIVAEDRERAQRLDTALLMKPFESRELLEVVAKLMGQRVQVPLERREIALYLDGYRIEGTAHLPSDRDRFSDAWEALLGDKRICVPLTAVTVFGSTDEPVAKTDFLQVSKAQIKFAMPLKQTPNAGDEGAS